MDVRKFLDDLNSKRSFLKESSYRLSLENFIVDEIENFELINKIPSDTPNNVLFDETEQMRRLIVDIYRNNETLYVLTGRRFEELIAELLSNQGFEAQLTQQTRDGGYDILAIQKLLGQYPIKFLVECRKYDSSRKVGVEAVRSFSHVISKNGANKGILVTTSYFTKDAINEAQSPYLLDFRDKDKVLEWVKMYLRK